MTAPAGEQIVLRVTDTGIGISPEMLPRVFEPFAQDAQALDRAQGGLGLGLAIVANLVKLHGGEVRAESAGLGQGSTFTLNLPASSATVGHPVRPAHVAPATARGDLRVLIVDDNEDAAEMLARALERLGCEIRVAHDGAEALRVARELSPNAAVLDIGLPVMDGYELAGRLRAEQGERPLGLIAVTGYGQESDRRRAKAAGFDAHLTKPVDLAELAALLEVYRQPQISAQA